MKTTHLELISFNICPFVQRSVIALNEKGIEFDTTYIDINEPPEWFTKISPMGKVPVLRVNDTAIFESMVIAEYLEEVYPPNLHPSDAIEKARHRSWIEYASELTMKQYCLLCASDETEFDQHKVDFKNMFDNLSTELNSNGPFFSGSEFKMIDAAYAPIFMRIELFERYFNLALYPQNSRLDIWSKALLQKDSVITSVAQDFDDACINYFRNDNYYVRKFLIADKNTASAVV